MLGEILKIKREELGLDLREVAHALRFQYEYLKALEDEDIKRLPPDVYVKAYIRGYAKLLSIDPLPLLDDYAELGRRNVAEVQPELPWPKKNPPLPGKALFAALVTVIGLTLVVLRYAGKPEAPVLPPASVPEAGAPSEGPQEHVLDYERKPEAPVLPPASVPEAGVPSKGPQEHVLDVTATETTWLLIETEEGISEEVLLRPGETRKWTSESGFDLKVGNAGGIRLAFDNNDIGTPGEKGRVVRLHLP